MGELSFFDLNTFINEYNTKVFVETGTYLGEGLSYAQTFSFEKLYSVEIVPSQAFKLKKQFNNDSRIKIFAGNSFDFLNSILPKIDANILFWLDAHISGAGLKENCVFDVPKELMLPLETELKIIKNLRSEYADVILIDDLRLYEIGKFEYGTLEDVGISYYQQDNATFIYELFSDTHDIRKIYDESGFVVLTPKNQIDKIPSDSFY